MSDTETATAGYYQISWESDYKEVELQEALDPNFSEATTTYTGSDRASLFSGKSNATYYYRIRGINPSETSDWSEPVVVKVAHHPLNRAFFFLTLGFLIFIALVFVVLRGVRSYA
jgi:hypothetical protein